MTEDKDVAEALAAFRDMFVGQSWHNVWQKRLEVLEAMALRVEELTESAANHEMNWYGAAQMVKAQSEHIIELGARLNATKLRGEQVEKERDEARAALAVENQERANLIRWQDAMIKRIRQALRLRGDQDDGVTAHYIEDMMKERDGAYAEVKSLTDQLMGVVTERNNLQRELAETEAGMRTQMDKVNELLPMVNKYREALRKIRDNGSPDFDADDMADCASIALCEFEESCK